MARIWVVDTETTGIDYENDKIVEVGGVLLDGSEVIKTYESLVNPGIPIPPTSSAIHHITDDMVADAPILDAAIQPFLEEEFDFIVAHNAKFDSAFLDLGSVDWICSWKLANVSIPDAPGYGNQVLRYFLGLDGPVSQTHAHRALYDAEVTANLFVHILGLASKEDPFPAMVEVTKNPIVLRGKVGFGEHADKYWNEVPKSYLNWMINKASGWDENRLHTARYWKDRIG